MSLGWSFSEYGSIWQWRRSINLLSAKREYFFLFVGFFVPPLWHLMNGLSWLDKLKNYSVLNYFSVSLLIWIVLLKCPASTRFRETDIGGGGWRWQVQDSSFVIVGNFSSDEFMELQCSGIYKLGIFYRKTRSILTFFCVCLNFCFITIITDYLKFLDIHSHNVLIYIITFS